MGLAATWLERHQVAVYPAALAIGAFVGLLAPPVAGPAGAAVLPLAAAVLTQLAGRRMRAVRTWARRVSQTMVPITALTLAVVVASQISGIGARIQALLLVVPIFVLFAAVMTGLGAIAGRVAGLEPSTQRAVLFSGVTRNSLVVLPLALALPATDGLAPLAVVTQTLIELVVMVVLMPLAPRLLPERRAD